MILPCFPNSLEIFLTGRNFYLSKKAKNKQAFINFFGHFIVKFNQSNPLVPPGNLYYIAGSFGNPEIVKVVSLLIKINTENNHICIRGFDNDPALLSQFFERFVSM
jgi:hypothetical protein